MKWEKVKLKKDKEKKVRIAKIKGNTFMVEEQINESTRRFTKVEAMPSELSDLKKQNYIK